MTSDPTGLVPFDQPKRSQTSEGLERKAGIEFEFAGVEPEVIAGLIIELFGGRIEIKNRFLLTVVGAENGDFTVEADARFLKDQAYHKYAEMIGLSPDDLEGPVEDMIAEVASHFVPYEVGTPPFPMSALGKIDALRQALHRHHAQGTKASFLYAFGLHVNAEAPDLEVETLLAYLRAFFLLFPWLKHQSEVAIARRITPYLNSFPEEYTRLVIDPAYAPDRDAFVADYLRHNPTRNRPLDLLPILAKIDHASVRRLVADEGKTKPRAAFHYRLPNCLIDEPNWTVAQEWNRWVKVENLAADPARIASMSEACLEAMTLPLGLWETGWREEVERWLA